ARSNGRSDLDADMLKQDYQARWWCGVFSRIAGALQAALTAIGSAHAVVANLRLCFPMNNRTAARQHPEDGKLLAAGELLPLVYEDLRKMAAQKMAQEGPNQTLRATA